MFCEHSAESNLVDKIEKTLAESLNYLLREPEKIGNWGDVRGTADSLIAIHKCLPNDRFPILREYATSWLLSRMENNSENNGKASWEEEVWDTSIAVLALSEEPSSREAIIKSTRWLSEQFQVGHGNWNDEPWETLWALLALHAAYKEMKLPFPDIDFERTFNWLMSLRGTPQSGILINWHYTALFTLVAKRYSMDSPSSVVSDHIRVLLRDTHKESVQCLAEFLIMKKEELWTNEIWSNSLAVWALFESIEDCPDQLEKKPVANWFFNQLQNQASVFTEDRAFACIGLFYFILGIKKEKKIKIDNLCTADLSPQVMNIMQECSTILGQNVQIDLQNSVSKCLGTVSDYTPRAPIFATDVFHGYYTINLRDFPTNIFVTITTTGILTIAAQNAHTFFGKTVGQYIIWIPLALGTLATIAQLMNFNLPKLFSRSKSQNLR